MARKRKTVKKTVVRRRRRKTTSKTFLSEMLGPGMAQAAAKTMLSGSVGGVAAKFLEKFLPEDMELKTKSFYQLAGSFATAAFLKMPNVAAGMAGVGMVNLLTESGFLGENGEIGYEPSDLEMLPPVLSEDNYLMEDNTMLADAMYLSEDYSYTPESGPYEFEM